MIKHIAFRVDASAKMGSGHVMRTLTLAQALRGDGWKCSFFCRLHIGHLVELIEAKGFEVYSFQATQYSTQCSNERLRHAEWLGVSQEQDAKDCIECLSEPLSWLVVDHYGLDATWERYLRPYTNKIMVIDDLADRIHDCDILLDQNLYSNSAARYWDLIPSSCISLLGPTYALLREEFALERHRLNPRDGKMERLLIFFGATDPLALVLRAVEVVATLRGKGFWVDVIAGNLNPQKEEISKKCSGYGFHYFEQVSNIASLMAKADVAIGAGGTTVWERCCLGLPSIVSSVAKNQDEGVLFQSAECLIFYCEPDECFETRLASLLNELAKSPKTLSEMSTRCLALVDGLGCQRVIDVLESKKIQVK